MVLEKILESPLNCKEMQPVHSEGDQPWNFFGRNDAEAEITELRANLARGHFVSPVFTETEFLIQG